MQDSTRIIRATLTEPVDGNPLHSGPVFASPFHAAGDPAGIAYTYGRSHNPTWTELERAIAVLESADAGVQVRTFASGLAAVAAVFGAELRPGDRVVVQDNAYFAARQLLEELFVPMGVTVETVTTGRLTDPSVVAGAKLVWLETPSNPRLEVVDIALTSRSAHEAGALLAVDNTTATPLGQRPLDLGADFSVCSDSKAMCGHSDLLLGHVATKDAGLLAKIDRHRTLTGAIPGPMEAWLALRSLSTLPLRLERISENALGLARFLSGRSEVAEVLYPGLEGHAGHSVAKAQMRYFGPVLGFTLRSKAAAARFLRRAELVTEATSFGGVTTTAERRARWGHDNVAEGFIRLSAGCEDLGDLIADLSDALEESA